MTRKKKAATVAQLQICDCGFHGCIIFPSGPAKEVSSQEEALTAIVKAVHDGRLLDSEAEALVGAIEQSSLLPEKGLALFLKLKEIEKEVDRLKEQARQHRPLPFPLGRLSSRN